MATTQAVQALIATDTAFDQVDRDALMRRNLGDESLAETLEPRLEEIDKLRTFVKAHAAKVHTDAVNAMAQNLTQIATHMKNQAGRPAADYIQQRQAFITQLDTFIEETRRSTPAFVASAVLERGFLEDEGFRQEAQRAIQTLKDEATRTIAAIEEESSRTIENAKKLAEEIETRARRTATGISVAEAQKQFQSATNDLGGRVRLWAILTGLAVVLMVIVPLLMMGWELPGADDMNGWPTQVYQATLRLFILSSVVGFLVFCIRVLRSHLHLAERNRHRVRVANSVESFVNSALEPQQRDLILARLVESIVDFGDSGLISQERDEVASPALSADGIGRILSALTSRNR